MSLKIIFHYPGPFYEDLNTGEKKRPVKLYQAFKELGHQVTLINGPYKDRKKKILSILPHLNEFDFLYSENSNIPLALTNNRRLPLLNSIDYHLFKEAKKINLKSGVYIRDAYIENGHISNKWKFRIGKFFHNKELNLYKNTVNKIFLPSKSLQKYYPNISNSQLDFLPPGCENFTKISKEKISKFRLLYVGSCRPPVYDLTEMLSYISSQPHIHLQIITRIKDIKFIEEMVLNFPNIKVNTASNNELNQYYESSDIYLLAIKNNTYWDTALPLKLFEAIGHKRPIICLGENEISNFITKYNIGWKLSSVNSIDKTLSKLTKAELIEKDKNLIKVAKRNSWEARVKMIIQSLL